MKIEITGKGFYGANGEAKVGSSHQVSNEPSGWKGRYTVMQTKTTKKKAVVNPELTELRKQAGELSIDFDETTTANALQIAIDAKLAL